MFECYIRDEGNPTGDELCVISFDFPCDSKTTRKKTTVPPLHIFELLLIFDNNAYALNWAMSFMLLLLKKKFIYVDSE